MKIARAIIREMKKVQPIPSAALLLDIFDKCWAANMRGVSVKGPKRGLIRSFKYSFFDGTTITWERPE